MRLIKRSLPFLFLLCTPVFTAQAQQHIFDLKDVVGEWFAPDGTKAFTIEQSDKLEVAARTRHLTLKGTFNWEGVMTDRGTVSFSRKPTPDQIDHSAPEWAREEIAKGTDPLEWELNLHLRIGCEEFVLEGILDRGEIQWREEIDTSEKIPPKRQVTKSSGTPKPVRYTKAVPGMWHETKPVDISGLEIVGLGSEAGKAQVAQIKSQIAKIQEELDAIDKNILKLEEGSKAAQAAKQRADADASTAHDRLLELSTSPEIKRIKEQIQTLRSKQARLLSQGSETEIPQIGLDLVRLQDRLIDEENRLQNRKDVQGASKSLDKMKAVSNAAEHEIAARQQQLTEAKTARSLRMDDLVSAYKKFEAFASPIKLLGIVGEDGKTLVSARLKDIEIVGRDKEGHEITLVRAREELADLEQLLAEYRLAMDAAKPAKDEAWDYFNKEGKAAEERLDQLRNLILTNAVGKAGAEGITALAKIGKATSEGGPGGFVVEIFELGTEGVRKIILDADKPVGANAAAIEKEVEEEIKTEIHEEARLNLGELKERAVDETENLLVPKGIVMTLAGPYGGGQIISHMASPEAQRAIALAKTLTTKSKLLKNVVDHYKEFAGNAVKDHLKELPMQVVLTVGVETISYFLDKQEAALWREYYAHEVDVRVAHAVWAKAAGTYWEGAFNNYELTQQQIIKQLQELASQKFQYEVLPAEFPARTRECAQLEITIVPAQPTDRESVFFGNFAADPITGPSTAEHRYRFKVPIIDEGGASSFKVRVVKQN